MENREHSHKENSICKKSIFSYTNMYTNASVSIVMLWDDRYSCRFACAEFKTKRENSHPVCRVLGGKEEHRQ